MSGSFGTTWRRPSRTLKCFMRRSSCRPTTCTSSASALTALGEEHARGEWHISLEDEDGQTALEKRLTERIGAAGGRVHLGRSRNDQVLTAIRLYLRDAIEDLGTGSAHVVDALDRLAAREASTVLPGYTHMQQAMPSSVALWAGGFAAEIRDDAEGLRQVQRRVGQEPAGICSGLRHAGITPGSWRDPRQTRVRCHAGAGNRRATVTRQGGSAPVV